jgi:hypothetical protein
MSSVGVQNSEPLRAPEHQPLSITALTIPAASSLGVQFVHVATAANIDAHTTLIDHPLTNGNPLAVIIVTENRTPGGVSGAINLSHIGVFYNIAHGQWGIYNEDSTTMPIGETFNVIIPTAGTGVFIQTVSTSFNSTTLDNPLANNNPNATIFVTPVYNPGGGVSGTNANFPISVLYNNISNRWMIFDQNGGTMPLGTSFNVFVPTAGTGIFVHTTTANDTGGVYTLIDSALTNGHPNAIVFVTPALNPGGLLDEHSIGVIYGNGYWKIFNRDGTDMPINTAFNVLVLVPHPDIFVHKATAGNIQGSATNIDNAFTNGHSNAIVFVTPNWNPDGVGGTMNSQNVGIYYAAGLWRILNQGGAAMPITAAFNVLVPDPDTSVFVHKATAANILSHSTIIDYPLTNGNPNAIIFVASNYNPGGVGGVYDNHPIGVFYDGSNWRIFNQDGLAMPVNAAFNVFVPTPGPGVFVHTATAVNSGSNLTIIDNALTNGNPNAIIHVTPNWNPGGVGGVNVNFPIGVGYESSINKWVIFSQNGGADTMPVGAAFNVNVSPYIDVNIGGALQGNYFLTTGQSRRVNYAGVDSGPVKVVNTGGIPIIAAIREAWAVNGVTTSFFQMMGLPQEQLSDTYVFPGYNNVTLNEQLRISNVDSVSSSVTVTIGGVLRGTYPLAAGEAVRINYAGLDSGPVVVQGTTGVKIISAIREAWAVSGVTKSFVQLMGLPKQQLSDQYVFPGYNNVTLNEQLRIGNVDTVASTVTVTIGGVPQGTYTLYPPGSLLGPSAVRVNYAGVDSGPVIVQGTTGVKIISAIREAWAVNGVTTSFAQLMGLPSGQLSNKYVFPGYNNVTLNDQLRIGNVDSVQTTVTVMIGRVLRGTYTLQPNEAVRVNYAGVDSGPVVVEGTTGVNIISAIREAWAVNGVTTSFVQLMGLPSGQLSSTFWFPAYNNVTLNEQLRIAVP